MFGDDPRLARPTRSRNAVEALAVRWRHGGVTQPAPVQFRISLRGLAERQTLPLAEVGFDEIVVDGDVEPERLGRRGRGVVCPLQR